MTVQFLNADAFDVIKNMNDESLDAVITDPPYFLDSMGTGDSWDAKGMDECRTANQVVSSLKGGMKFDKQQGVDFQNAMNSMALESLRVLKPGGWFISFSAPRLYHRLAIGVEDAGFEIRDMMEWLYTQNQMKAMGLKRQLGKDDDIDDNERMKLSYELANWKTPQMKSCFEPIVIAQKPREGTFYENWRVHHIGLINVRTNQGDGQMTANVMTSDHMNEIIDHAFLVNKPDKKEKTGTTHPSVKPLSIMRQLIRVFIPEGGRIFDPFLGSGTTGFTALDENIEFIGTEINYDYYQQALARARSMHYIVNETNDGIAVITNDNGLFE